MRAADHMVEGRFTPAAPFEFAHTLASLTGSSAEHFVIDPYRFLQGVSVDATPIVAEVWTRGKVESPLIQYRFHAASPISPGRAAMLERWLRFYLSADDALQPLYDLAWDDPPFAAVVEQLYGYHQLKFPTPFAAAVWALLSQRTSWPQARARMDRLRTALGSPLLVADRSITPLPAAATVAAQSATDLAALIGDARKGATLHAAATAFAAVDPAFLTDAPAAAVRRWLEEIPGIGRWSATLVLVRGLGRMQALRPPFERRLVAAAQKVYGPPTAAPALQQLAARYGSQQGYWAHYLRRHTVATRS